MDSWMASIQCILTTELSGEHWSINATDLRTGTTLRTFKIDSSGGPCKPRTLGVLNHADWLVAAENDKSLVHFWPLKGTERQVKVVCPGRVTALAVTTKGDWCIVGISEKIYIWETSTGGLIDVLERHYQPVCVIRVSAVEGDYIVTGGEDGLALVWYVPNLYRAFCRRRRDPASVNEADREPLYIWRQHTAQVTDIAIGKSGNMVVTGSKDKTCQLYQLESGCHLATLIFDTPIYSVAMDAMQNFLFAGGEDGKIYETLLRSVRVKSTSRSDEEEAKKAVFIGHTGKVTCLSVSIDGSALVSGSADQTVRLWQVTGKYCKRTVQHKGPIADVLILMTPPGIKGDDVESLQTDFLIKPFRRSVEDKIFDYLPGGCPTKIAQHNQSFAENDGEEPDSEEEGTGGGKSQSDELANLREEVAMLRQANQDLYKFALDELISREANRN